MGHLDICTLGMQAMDKFRNDKADFSRWSKMTMFHVDIFGISSIVFSSG
jgi:hypothetical protein